MLIVTRKVGEKIVVYSGSPPEVVVTVVAVRGLEVRVGIETPRNFSIDREEVYLKKQAARARRT